MDAVSAFGDGEDPWYVHFGKSPYGGKGFGWGITVLRVNRDRRESCSNRVLDLYFDFLQFDWATSLSASSEMIACGIPKDFAAMEMNSIFILASVAM